MIDNWHCFRQIDAVGHAFEKFILAAGLLLISTDVRADSEIVIAIRYLQAEGTSHVHLYLYREDGKFLRQLTKDNSGQDFDPIFAADGSTILFTREKPNVVREFWSVDPLGKQLKKLDAPPEWYTATKSSPYFTNAESEEAASPSPTPSPESSPGAASSTSENAEQSQHVTETALDASARAQDRPPANIKSPNDSGEIFWRRGKDKNDPLDWVMWFRDSKSGKEIEIGNLPGFPSFEPMHETEHKDQQFLFDGPLRFLFFDSHLNSTDGSTVLAFDFNRPRLEPLSPNWATPILLPNEPAFLTLTENRYVPIPGSTKTANCSYLERWDEKLNHIRYAREKSAAICYGMSMYRSGKNPPVITMRRGAD